VIPSETFRSRNPLAVLRTGAILGLGLARAWRLLGVLRPAAVIGFGGYPTLPPVLAATLRRIPSVIHEQNAVMGRANRLLAPRVTAIAAGFPGVTDADAGLRARTTLTGNPVRPAVTAASAVPYPQIDPAGPLRLVVFGGSQGARVFSDIVPPAVARLDPAIRARLVIVQQARDEDLDRVRRSYADLAVAAEVAPFFSDLPGWSRAPAPRRSPSSPPSAGPPSWSRCRTRSTRTSSPTLPCWRRPAAQSCCARMHSPRSGSPPSSRRSPPTAAAPAPWRTPRALSARPTRPDGSPTWCCGSPACRLRPAADPVRSRTPRRFP
jgi:hypothetical protein